LVPFSFISYLLPNAANKANFLATDLSMKNTYIGLFVFFFFLISLTRLDGLKKIILGFTLFSFLFSLGDLVPVQKFSYHFLPLMDTFRHPGTIRIFTCIGMIWLAAFSMEEFFVGDKKQLLKRLSYVTLGILLFAAIYFLATDSYESVIPFSLHPSVLKELLYTLSFKQFAAFIAVLQILFLIAFIFLLERRLLLAKAAKVLIILNSVVFAWMGLPFNVVSQYKTADVNAYINSFPDGYPMPDVHGSIESDIISDSIEISVHGYHNFYNKKITIQDKIITPTLNSDYEMFLGDFPLRRQLKGYPFVYLTDSLQQRIDSADIKLVHLTPNSFAFAVRINQSAEMHLFQQYNHNWHVTINKRPAEIRKSNIAFMKVQLPATSGSLIIKWNYRPKNVYSGIIISLVTLLAIILYFVFRRKLKTKYA